MKQQVKIVYGQTSYKAINNEGETVKDGYMIPEHLKEWANNKGYEVVSEFYQPEQYPTPQEQENPFRNERFEDIIEGAKEVSKKLKDEATAVQGDIVQGQGEETTLSVTVPMRGNRDETYDAIIEAYNAYPSLLRENEMLHLQAQSSALKAIVAERENKELKDDLAKAMETAYRQNKQNQQQAKDIEELSCFISDLYRRLYETMGRVGGSSSFGDTFHVMYDDKMSIGDKMAELMGKHKK